MTITSRIDGITKIDAAHSGVFIYSAAFRALRQAHLDRDLRGTACESCAAA